MAATKKIPSAVLDVLASMEVRAFSIVNVGYVAQITEGTLDRKLYLDVNKVLEALGGKWDRREKVHVFNEDPSDAIDACVLTGAYTDKKQALQFFETPEALADELVAAAGIEDGMRVLEPSAGRGRIVHAIRREVPGAEVYAMELDKTNFDRLAKIELEHLDFHFVPMNGDFMSERSGFYVDNLHTQRMLFDRVVMNPPFSKRQDIDHVTRAYGMLKPTGRLISVVSGSAVHRIDKKGEAFAALVKRCGSHYDLPEGTFKESGTNVRASVVVLNKE